jgi:hypothetical protein
MIGCEYLSSNPLIFFIILCILSHCSLLLQSFSSCLEKKKIHSSTHLSYCLPTCLLYCNGMVCSFDFTETARPSHTIDSLSNTQQVISLKLSNTNFLY